MFFVSVIGAIQMRYDDDDETENTANYCVFDSMRNSVKLQTVS